MSYVALGSTCHLLPWSLHVLPSFSRIYATYHHRVYMSFLHRSLHIMCYNTWSTFHVLPSEYLGHLLHLSLYFMCDTVEVLSFLHLFDALSLKGLHRMCSRILVIVKHWSLHVKCCMGAYMITGLHSNTVKHLGLHVKCCIKVYKSHVP